MSAWINLSAAFAATVALAFGAQLPLGSSAQAQAIAQKPVTVVELFTSQGCNSCPPADKFLLELVARQDRDNLIVLGYHVDYWDYLGWADTFATPQSTARQRGYMRSLRLQSVYTPQIVVGGRYERVGADKAAVEAAIEQARATVPGGGANVWFDYAENGAPVLRVEPPPASDFKVDAEILLVLFADTKNVPIARGEHAGKTIGYANIVQTMLHLAKWDGRPATFSPPTGQLSPGASFCAAIVQQVNQGPILGAVRARITDGTW
ncbi:MAG: DUF1223 domain-containing protein [Alphaproteobacteria bacterium]|nr:DUF1223 domain-containing protein [Alphaproteobacteria bacterium]